jgi:Peptidase family M28
MKKFFGLLATLTLMSAGLYWYTLVMPGRSHSGPLPALSQDERAMAATMRGYVEAVASRPHNTSFPAELEVTARQIEATLQSFGYTPTAQKFTASGIEVRNIEVVLEPSLGAGKDITTLVVGAHYDSAGDAPGANDNGSGVAALLILARELRRMPRQNTRLRLVFFVNEEPPHFKTPTMGSLVYARALAATGERVRGMISLETLGSYSDQKGSQAYPPPLGYLLPDTGNFVAVVGDMSARSLAADVTHRFRDGTAFPSIGGVAPESLPGITWSDHWSFGEVKIAAVMITDTAVFRYPHYHLTTDTPDKLDYERLARVTAGLVQVVSGLAP